MLESAPEPVIVQVDHLTKHFALRTAWASRKKRVVHALDAVSLNIQRGEVLGLVGESGCGKTTFGRCLLYLIKPTGGEVRFEGEALGSLDRTRMRQVRASMQIVFQNPYLSLDPRWRVRASLEEPLRTHGVDRSVWASRIDARLAQVGLGRQHLNRYPHELSGGQCQRIAVARALMLEPRLLVLDEPTSSLDVSVQAQIINLLNELRTSRGLTYVFISHDLGVVQHLSDRIGIMYLGKLVELGRTEDIFAMPKHPYTKALIAAIPSLTPGGHNQPAPLEGGIPSPVSPPPGCRFHTRCPIAQAVCREQEPPLREVQPGWQAACHFV